MAEICRVDAELFESLQAAIDFVDERGGGIVYSQIAGTQYAKSLKLPDNVRLEQHRPAAARRDGAGESVGEGAEELDTLLEG